MNISDTSFDQAKKRGFVEKVSNSSCVTTNYNMTDTKEQADKNATDCNIEENNTSTRDETSSQVTSVAHYSNSVHIGTSRGPNHFHGDVYIHSGGRKEKHVTVQRERRRKSQRARSATMSEARREAQQQEWQARRERQREENESRWAERDRKEGQKISKEEQMAKDLEKEKGNADRKAS